MLAPFAVHSFSGEPGDNVQLGEFLKTFCCFIMYAHITENSNIIESFGNHLKYGSPADKWFSELDTTQLTWKQTEKVFLECFPPVEKAKRTETELERELCKLRLKVEDLGKKEKYAGEEVYTHVIFAEKALSLARQAKISRGSNSIWKVCDELPEIIRQKVKETYLTWTDFCAAIKGIEMAHIWDGVKKYQEEKELRERTEVAIAGLQHIQQQQQHHLPAAPMTLVSSVSQAMQATTLGAQRSNQTTTSNTPQCTQPQPSGLPHTTQQPSRHCCMTQPPQGLEGEKWGECPDHSYHRVSTASGRCSPWLRRVLRLRAGGTSSQ